MTTGGIIVIALMLTFVLLGSLLAAFTRHQVKVHLASLRREADTVPPAIGVPSASDLDLPSSFAHPVIYPTTAHPGGRVILRSTGRKATVVHEG